MKPTTLSQNSPGPSLAEVAPGRLETLEALDGSWEVKNSSNPDQGGLYLRDADPRVVALERAISRVTIPKQELNVSLPSGMNAIDVAVGSALSMMGEKLQNSSNSRESLKLAHGKDLYAQSARLLKDYKNMGIEMQIFDSGDHDEIDKALDWTPHIILCETVANSPRMPVADVHRILEWNRAAGNNTMLIFDNTLTKKTGFDFESVLEPWDNALIVESISKAELLNGVSGVGGVIYSSNQEMIDEVRRYRTTHGPVIASSAAETYRKILEKSLPEFHKRNKLLFASTGKIALTLYEARKHLGSAADFDISYPSLPNHPNHDYAARYLPNGISPVVFISTKNGRSGRELLARVSSHPRIKEQVRAGQSFFGQSFGFSEATYFYHPDFPYVRLSGGYDMDIDEFTDALKEAVINE